MAAGSCSGSTEPRTEKRGGSFLGLSGGPVRDEGRRLAHLVGEALNRLGHIPNLPRSVVPVSLFDRLADRRGSLDPVPGDLGNQCRCQHRRCLGVFGHPRAARIAALHGVPAIAVSGGVGNTLPAIADWVVQLTHTAIVHELAPLQYDELPTWASP